MKPFWRISLRAKIVGLVSVAILVSLFSYLLIGTSLITEDKLSYIYAYNQEEVRSIADALDSQLQKIATFSKVFGRLIGHPLDAHQNTALRESYVENASRLGIEGLLFLKASGPDHFVIELEFGAATDEAKLALARMGWAPHTFHKSSLLVGVATADGRIPFGGTASDADGNSTAFLALLKPKLVSAGGFRNGLELHVVDTVGTSLGSPAPGAPGPDPGPVKELAQSLWKEGFPSGARNQDIAGTPSVVSYQRSELGGLLTIGIISRQVAFAASRALVYRTLFLGAGIFLLALGGTLLFIRTITTRLKAMWAATQKVSQGDFSIRVKVTAKIEDEISGLATSFNAMADRIGALMAETAQKARMENELETAKVVQSLYFPHEQFNHPLLQISGRCVPASECSGDWWHYALIGDRMVVVVGDVTGHGVSAALVTAAAHSAFSAWRTDALALGGEVATLRYLSARLNAAVIAAGGGKSGMTMVASLIDLNTGVMEWINAAHPAAYLCRMPEGASAGKGPTVTAVSGARNPWLGDPSLLAFNTATIQLQPGDRLIWYTDGILETRPSDEQRYSRPVFVKRISEAAERKDADSQTICTRVIEDAVAFFGKAADERPDDITVIVATIRGTLGAQSLLPADPSLPDAPRALHS